MTLNFEAKKLYKKKKENRIFCTKKNKNNITFPKSIVLVKTPESFIPTGTKQCSAHFGISRINIAHFFYFSPLSLCIPEYMPSKLLANWGQKK